MFTKPFFALVLSSLAVFPGAYACESDADCPGNRDCIRVGPFKKGCFPVSCAKGAAQALLDSGFDAPKYISTIRGRTGLRNSDMVSLSGSESHSIRQAMLDNPFPRAVFDQNYTACMSANVDEEDTEQVINEATDTGLQLTAGALFQYIFKSIWGKQPITGDDYQVTSNCIGALLGGDAGLDLLIQIRESNDRRISANIDPEQTDVPSYQFVPIAILGPIGISVGWIEDNDIDDFTITEITLGAGLGAALGGFSHCFQQIQFP